MNIVYVYVYISLYSALTVKVDIQRRFTKTLKIHSIVYKFGEEISFQLSLKLINLTTES